MRLVGREIHSDDPSSELLTFECACGQIVTATTNQIDFRFRYEELSCRATPRGSVGMAPIRSYLDEDAAFDSEATRAMGQAFEQACAALNVAGDDKRGRRVIAARIIDLARAGLTEARALRDRVLDEASRSA
jgi:hypothetical protein